MSLANFLLIYIFGGLTFFPLLGVIIYVIIFQPWTKRVKSETIKFDDKPPEDYSNVRDDSSYHKFGWLRVTKEYDPSNNNGASNGSSFGNMMKSFIEASGQKQQPKRTKDSFFAVLKYNTLFMYESERQLDCKGIIIVSNYDVAIFPEQLPDNEIFTKVNSMRLTLKPSVCADLENNNCHTTDYYLFCNTGVEREDWYFALQRSSKLESSDSSTGQQVNKDKSQFDPFAMNHLLNTLYSNDDHMQTQWLNAVLGRMFLSVYKTQKVKEYFIRKLVKKIKKVKKPGFLSDIQIKSVDVGDGIPYVTNPELVKLSQDGELNVDINLNYTGGFRVEIETEAILSVKGLKPIKVPLVLAVVIRGLQGKMLVRIKPPPTNRLWVGFYEMPKLDLLIEPVVSETHLKFAPIINTIESKIHEMIMDSIVLPNMDDTPFFNSFGMGGIYEGEVEQQQQQMETQMEAQQQQVEAQQAEMPPIILPSRPPSLSSTDSERESLRSSEEEVVVTDIQSISTEKEEVLHAIISAPAKLESAKSESTKSESTKIEVIASAPAENNSSSSSWTSRATKINKKLSAFHESLSEPNLIKSNPFRLRSSIAKQFTKQWTDDSSTTEKEPVKESVKEQVKESNEGNKGLLSSDSVQTTSSSTSPLRRWSQIRRRTASILNSTSITSNNSNSSSSNNTTNNTSDSTLSNTESDAQIESTPITFPVDLADSVDKQNSNILVEEFASLGTSPLNISPLSTSPASGTSSTIATSPSRSASMESLNLPTRKSSSTSLRSTKSTTHNDTPKTATPTPPPSPPKSPKEPSEIHLSHSPHSPHSPPHSSSKNTYNRDLFLSGSDEFFPDVVPPILNTPVEELNSVLG